METGQERGGVTRWLGLSFLQIIWVLSFLVVLFLSSSFILSQLRSQLQGLGLSELSNSFHLIEYAVYSIAGIAGLFLVVGAIALSRSHVSLKHTRQLQNSEDLSELSSLRERVQVLKEREQRFYFLLDASPSCIFVKDADLRYLFVNKRWMDLKGKTLDSVIGKNDIEVFGENDSTRQMVDEEKNIFAGALAVKKEQQCTVGGHDMTFLADMVPLKDESGELFAIGGWYTDITYYKRTYEELEKARQQADSLNQAKSSFLATMSHEIRTPMNGVIGSLDLLRTSRLDKSQKQLVDTVNESAFSLLTIINDILDFSKIESGKLELDIVPVDLEQLMVSATAALIPQARQKNVELIVYTDTDIPNVYADLVRLRQIVSNLGSNAIKFSGGKDDGKGRVIVRCTLDSMDDAGNATINISVEDNGIGISEEAQSHLFQPFIQAEGSTTRRFGGSGLGLSITSRLAKMMNGEIGVRSSLGEGAVFTASIPLEVVADESSEDSKEASREESAEGSHSNLSGLPVLFIQGDEHVNEPFVKHLKHEGMLCYEASRSEEEWSQISIEHDGELVIIIVDCWVNDLGVPALKRQLEAQFSYVDKLSFLILSQGYLLEPQLQSANTIKLDYNGLGRKAFLNTINQLVKKSSNSIDVEIDMEVDGAEVRASSPELNEDKLLLLAEDNEVNQQVLKHQLSVLGYPVEIANDGVEALSLWTENQDKYHLILTDCHMPNLDGYGLSEAIREREQGDQRIPIIAITADALQGTNEQCRQAGMDDYLTKPLLIDDLSAKLEKWLYSREESTDTEQSEESEEQSGAKNEAVNPETLVGFLGTSTDSTLREFYLQYQSSSEPIIQKISGSSDSGEKEEGATLAALAHKLKSSSYAIGAKKLGDLCIALEMSLDQSNDAIDDSCQKIIEQLLSEHTRVENWITKNYSSANFGQSG